LIVAGVVGGQQLVHQAKIREAAGAKVTETPANEDEAEAEEAVGF